MKRTAHYVFVLLLLLATEASFGQLSTGYHQLVRSSWELDKKDIIEDLMQFTPQEAKAFWPIYNRHMENWGRAMEFRIDIAQQYCNKFPEMSAPKVSEYVNQLVSNDIQLTRMQKKLFKKVSKVLSPARSTQFIQIEYKFQLALLSQIQERTPFIGDNLKKL
jgi:hypothetical protein